ncbi:hypothetical protein Hanom_Chr07g00625591 [Helianthus anomalus]
MLTPVSSNSNIVYDVALALRVYRFRYWLRLFGEGNDQLFVIVM